MYTNKEPHYNPEQHRQVPTPEHEAHAEKIAIEIVERYSSEEQNEIARIIRKTISEKRQMEIEQIEQHLKHLKETLQAL